MKNGEPRSRQARKAIGISSHSIVVACAACVSLTQLSRFSAGADEHLDAVAGHRHETDAALLILLRTAIAAHAESRASACASVSERHLSFAPINAARWYRSLSMSCRPPCSYLQLGVCEIASRLVLRGETRRRIVAVASELAVVNTDHAHTRSTHTPCIATCRIAPNPTRRSAAEEIDGGETADGGRIFDSEIRLRLLCLSSSVFAHVCVFARDHDSLERHGWRG